MDCIVSADAAGVGLGEEFRVYSFGRHALFRESLLKQQSRSKRLQGDSNSKYFHIIINWRRRQNMIRGINVNAGYGRRNLKK